MSFDLATKIAFIIYIYFSPMLIFASDGHYNSPDLGHMPLVIDNKPGKDMSVIINKALVKAAKENRAVQLTSGTYLVDFSIIIPSNSKLIGVSSGDGIGMDFMGATILKGSASPMIRLCDVSSERSGFNAVLEDLWLLGKDENRQIGLSTVCDDNRGFRSFRLNGVNVRNFSTNYHIGGNSYHFDIKNFVSRVKHGELKKFRKAGTSKVMIDVGIEEINVGDIYFFSDGFSLEEALVMSTNQKDKTLTIYPQLKYQAGILFKKRVNFLIENKRGPTGSMISNGLVYGGVGMEWSAGGAPGVRIDTIDFDRSLIEIYFNNASGKRRSIIGPSLFGNIGSENNLFLNVFSNFKQSIIGIDNYVVNTENKVAKFLSEFRLDFTIGTLATRYCDTTIIAQNISIQNIFCAR